MSKTLLVMILLSASLAVKAAPLGQFTKLGTYCFQLRDSIVPSKPLELLYLTAYSSETENYFPIYGIHIADGKRSPAYGNAVFENAFDLVVSITTSGRKVNSSVYTLSLSLSRELHGGYNIMSFKHKQSDYPPLESGTKRTILPERPQFDVFYTFGSVAPIECEQ